MTISRLCFVILIEAAIWRTSKCHLKEISKEIQQKAKDSNDLVALKSTGKNRF